MFGIIEEELRSKSTIYHLFKYFLCRISKKIPAVPNSVRKNNSVIWKENAKRRVIPLISGGELVMNPGRFLQEGVGKQGCESISGGGHSVPELPLQSVQMLLPYPPPVMFLVPTSDKTYLQKLRSIPRGDSQRGREA